MKKSFWDSTIVKKYNSLSHYKLLSQLATELRSYPLIRNNQKEEDSIRQNKEKPEKISSHKKAELKQNSNSTEKETNSTKNLYSNIDVGNERIKHTKYIDSEESSSFQERLSEIDMR